MDLYTRFDHCYLQPLEHIADPPKQLWVSGDLPDRSQYKTLCVVGSRAHSNYAQNAVRHLIGGLAGLPVVVMSGLALGIDTLAHEQALQHGLPTIALPGSGLDESVIYPRSNRQLAQQIVDSGGALVSESEPTVRAARWTFPRRNRLMAALADVVLIVEAGSKSGTLITARLALDYGTTVATVPNHIFAEGSAGSNSLLRDGAHPVFGPADVAELLGLELGAATSQPTADLSPPEQTIVQALTEPLDRDQLLTDTGLDIATLNTTLSLLEIKGLVTESLGKFRTSF